MKYKDSYLLDWYYKQRCSKKEAAEKLGISKQLFGNWLVNGRVPMIQIKRISDLTKINMRALKYEYVERRVR